MMSAAMAAREAATNTRLELSVSRWRLQRLDLRRHLMQLFSCELLPAAEAETARTLQVLCTDLIDYISTGHFEIYGRVLRGRSGRDAEQHDLLEHVLNTIGTTTDAVLAFNDRYERPLHPSQRRHLAEDLARLSRNLLLRFAVEEQLLELLAE